jgi:hypothetical protein
MVSNPVQQLAPPDGFQQHASGLILPTDSEVAAAARERETWSEDEAKAILRAARILEHRGLVWIVGCRDNRCAEQPQLAQHDVPGGFSWVCQHKERRIVRGR